MIYDYVDDLVDAIRNDEPYKNYYQARQDVLHTPEIMTHIKTLERLMEEKSEQAQYAAYISLDEINEKIKKERQTLSSFSLMKKYQDALYDLNKQLEELSQIVFGNISEELVIGRMGTLYARRSR